MTRSRTLWMVAVGLVVVTVGAGYWALARDGGAEAPGDAAGVTSTAEVIRASISDTRSFGGTLGHGAAVTVSSAAQGVVTGLAEQGLEVGRAAELFRVDEQPVTALYGEVPMYRDLRVGDSGADVFQLEANLAVLGYEGFTVDAEFTSSTAEAVRQWQADLGRAETGVVAQSDVVFVPEGSRVDTVHTHVGGTVAPGSAVLDLTGSDHVVSLDLEVRDRDLLAVGTEVTILLPAGVEVAGSVTAANAVVAEAGSGDGASGGNGGSGSGDTMIEVEVTLYEPVDPALLGASADVVVEVDERADVLTAPVNALVALAGGGHGVEIVADDGTTSLVPVETGLFAGGRVEITGEGVDDGTIVVTGAR